MNLPGLAKPADLFIRVVGDETKEKKEGVSPILLIPGGPGLAHDYMETLEALVFHERRIITFDPIGTGQSSRALPPALSTGSEEDRLAAWSEFMQAQITQVLQFLEIDKDYHVWAHGIGALPAVQHAAAVVAAHKQNASVPTIKSLTLASPFVLTGGKAIGQPYTSNGETVPLCITESTVGTDPKQPPTTPVLSEEGAEAVFAKQWVGLPALGALDNVPVFLSYGENDAAGVGEAVGGRLKERLAMGAKEVVVKRWEGTGTLAHIDQPERYVDVSGEGRWFGWVGWVISHLFIHSCTYLHHTYKHTQWLDELLQGTEKGA